MAINFPPITEEEIQSFFSDSDIVLAGKIEEQMSILAKVQERNTHSTSKVGPSQKNIQLYQLYNTLKHRYYSRVIDRSKSDPRSFYMLMKTKFKTRATLPAIMSFGGINYSGTDRFSKMLLHLQLCFAISSYDFSPINNILAEQITDVYRIHYNGKFEQQWNTFEAFFTLDEVNNKISKLLCQKDPAR